MGGETKIAISMKQVKTSNSNLMSAGKKLNDNHLRLGMQTMYLPQHLRQMISPLAGGGQGEEKMRLAPF